MEDFAEDLNTIAASISRANVTNYPADKTWQDLHRGLAKRFAEDCNATLGDAERKAFHVRSIAMYMLEALDVSCAQWPRSMSACMLHLFNVEFALGLCPEEIFENQNRLLSSVSEWPSDC